MNIAFSWIGGATWILDIDHVRIACDPVLCPAGHIQDYGFFKTRRLNDPVYGENDFKNIDLWLLSHNHEDHLDSRGFSMIDKEASVIAHKGFRPRFRGCGFMDVRYLDWHDETSWSSDGLMIKIKSLPAIHAKRTIFSGMIGNGNGYHLEIARGERKYRVYVTGDSVYNEKIKNYFNGESLDLVIVNAGAAMIGRSLLSRVIGRITNNVNDIKGMIVSLDPGFVIPLHWGTFSHYTEKLEAGSFAHYPRVKILSPGESIALDRVQSGLS